MRYREIFEFDRSQPIKDKKDYERQLEEWKPTLALIGRYRLGEISLNSVRNKINSLRTNWYLICTFSVKTPRLMNRFAAYRKSMPIPGGQTLRLTRYEPESVQALTQ
jgi:hypothetical protein